MSEIAPNLEHLLRQALAPVEPPEDLAARVERTLLNLTEIAAEELEGWELSAMRDPRNWVRPAAALVVGTAAGAALVVVRARQREHSGRRGHSSSGGGLGAARDFAERALRDVGGEARRVVRRD
jgi:hypothetical protein